VTRGRAALAGALLGPLVLAGCLQAWPFNGPYRCVDGACSGNLVCDDGLCCQVGGTPACPTKPTSMGTCASGATPRVYYRDDDGDGFGNPDAGVLACARPVLTTHVDNADDCDDTQAAARPGGGEVCDGLDNDCDGVRDNGLPQRLYYVDQDGDDAGDPDGGVSACARPPGLSDNRGDCAPLDATVHPGAKERCNGNDDNCDGRIDESPVENEGQSCQTGRPSRCAAGTQQCVDAVLTCISTAQPQPDVCDQQDNDCDGQVDQRPDCGGPASLLGTSELTLGALVVPAGTSLAATCAKGATGARQGTWFPPNWLGTSTGQHLFFAEAQAGHAWDLSQPQATLALAFSFSALGTSASLNTGVKQPIVTLCNADARRFVRYEPKVNYDGGTTFRLAVPLAGSADWVRADGPAGVDLTAVTRVEVQLIAVPETTFTVKWLADGGFAP